MQFFDKSHLVSLIVGTLLFCQVPAAAQTEESRRTIAGPDGRRFELFLRFPKSGEAKAWPALVYFADGDFAKTRSSAEVLLDYMSDQGMAVIQVDYDNPVGSEHARNTESVLAGVRNVGAALTCLREHGRELNIDPEKIVASGMGDGAYFALKAALDAPEVAPRALVLLDPLTYEPEPLAHVNPGYYHKTFGDRLRELDPMPRIAGNSPPMIILAGERDGLVDIDSLCRWKMQAEDVGAACELVVYLKINRRQFLQFPAFVRNLAWHAHRFLASQQLLPSGPIGNEPNLAADPELRKALVGRNKLDPERMIAVYRDPVLQCPQAEVTAQVYREIDGYKLRVFQIDIPGRDKRRDVRPAFVWIHGGGWRGGAALGSRVGGDWLAYLVNRGMAVFSIEYRTWQYNKASPYECLKDCKSAFRYLRRHAAELGIEPNRMVSCGASAGGHLAMALGTVHGFEHAGEDLSVSCVPNAMVIYNGAVDNGPGGYGHERVADRYREFSPVYNLRKDTPPMVNFSGLTEGIVPRNSIVYIKRKLDSLGVRCEIHIYNHGGHAQMNLAVSPAVSRMVIWETDRFLASLGYLKGEPTIDVSGIRDTETVSQWDWRTADVGLDYLEERDRQPREKPMKSP